MRQFFNFVNNAYRKTEASIRFLRCSPIFLLLLATLFVTTRGSYAATVQCGNNSGDAAAIQNAANGGGTVTISGTCAMNTAISLSVANTSIAGSGNPNLNFSGGNSFNVLADHVTINGVIINNGMVAVPPCCGAPTINYFTFTNNTIQNVISGQSAGIYGEIWYNATISNNTFTNMWKGGFPANQGSSLDNWGSECIQVYGNVSQTAITYNTFNEIGNDCVNFHGQAQGGVASPTGVNDVIAYNNFANVHRAAIEFQAAYTNLSVKGNFMHDYAAPFWNSWGASLASNSNGVNFINNTVTDNTAAENCNGFLPAGLETAGAGYIYQGNIVSTINPLGNCGARTRQAVALGDSSGSPTWYFQNSILCGSVPSTTIAAEVSPHANPVVQYDYINTASCPNSNLTASIITPTWTSANNQSFPSGGNGTWNLAVVSNLSLRYIQFFADGSSSPVSTQELQDLNTNFGNDRRWLYHATLNTSTLGAGSHTLTARATDVSGAVQNSAQSFTVGYGGTPSVQLTPASLSFAPQTVGLTSSTQTVTLKNAGTATLAINGVSLSGTNAADFGFSNACGSSLGAGASCTIGVTFTSSLAAAEAASLVISDNASGSPHSVGLSGTGVAPITTNPPPTNPPTTGSLPTNLPKGMILWLANNADVVSNGKTVSAWDDESGNGNDAAQANAANQPTLVAGNNGQSALHFDGATSFLSFPSLPIDGLTGMTVLIVSANSNDVSGKAGYGSYGLLNWTESASWGGTFFASYQTTSHFRFGTTQAGNDLMFPMPFTRTNSFGLGEWMHSGTTDSMWFNGQSGASYPSKLQALAGAGTTVTLGRGANQTFYPGDVSEIIVYSRALGTSERQTIEQYLMIKYHL